MHEDETVRQALFLSDAAQSDVLTAARSQEEHEVNRSTWTDVKLSILQQRRTAFKDLLMHLNTLSMSSTEQMVLWRTLASIMHLRTTRAAPATVASRSSLLDEKAGQRAAQLLGLFVGIQ